MPWKRVKTWMVAKAMIFLRQFTVILRPESEITHSDYWNISNIVKKLRDSVTPVKKLESVRTTKISVCDLSVSTFRGQPTLKSFDSSYVSTHVILPFSQHFRPDFLKYVEWWKGYWFQHIYIFIVSIWLFLCNFEIHFLKTKVCAPAPRLLKV